MSKIRHPQWREEHEGNNYPFEDAAPLVNSVGDRLDPDAIVDAALYPLGASGTLFLSQIHVQPDLVRVSIGDAVTRQLCYGEITSVTASEVRLEDVLTIDDNGTPRTIRRPAGVLLLKATQAAEWFSWTAGDHEFESTQTPFVAAVCLPLPETLQGITGLVLDDGNVVTGPAVFLGHDGVSLECEQVGGKTVIRVHAVGDPLFLRRACAPGLFEHPRFIRRIVFQKGPKTLAIGPGTRGDVTVAATSLLTPDTILRIHPTSEGMSVELAGEQLAAPE